MQVLSSLPKSMSFAKKRLNDRGLLITLEGIDGCGKSSAARALFEALSSEYEVVLTKEPGDTELGKHLRQLLNLRTFDVISKAEFLLFAADRAQHIEEVVKPALQEGKVVISDRMADSSLAYQGYGRGLDRSYIEMINQWAMDTIKPDLTLYLKIDYETASKRLKKRHDETTVFEKERAAFFERIMNGFETMYKERSDVFTFQAALPEQSLHDELAHSVRAYVAGKFEINSI